MKYERRNLALKAVGSQAPEWAVFYRGCQPVCALKPWTTPVTFNWSL